jgi:hypothetical protein
VPPKNRDSSKGANETPATLGHIAKENTTMMKIPRTYATLSGQRRGSRRAIARQGKICLGCFQFFNASNRNDQQFCSKKCQRKDRNDRVAAMRPRYQRRCSYCRKKFETKFPFQIFCGRQCNKRDVRKKIDELKRNKKFRAELSDFYIRNLLNAKLGFRLKRNEFPPEIVELKRSEIRLLRALQNKNKTMKGQMNECY